jgi:glycosyltransferase involved in cell wall biosynthesis
VSATRPLISVVTPSYNQGPFIERCIRSVLNQDYPDFEHIVFDNCSNDETHAVLKKYPHVQWTSEPDRGQSDALNKGFRQARGEIIAWINADDYYAPGAFALAASELHADTGLKAIAGSVQVVDPDGALQETTRQRFEGLDYLVEYWNESFGICQPGVLFRRELLDELGLLDISLHYAMDYHFWLRLAARYPIKVVDQVVANYIVHPASKTGGARCWGGFREEWERCSRAYWGPRWSPRHWRLARACSRHAADIYVQSLLESHKHDPRLDRSLLWKLARRRPLRLLDRNVLSVLADRLRGRGATKPEEVPA